MIANCNAASPHFGGAFFHFAVMLRNASQISFTADSSLGAERSETDCLPRQPAGWSGGDIKVASVFDHFA